jgi:predicted protein tyrosine phosphatase
MNLLFVCSENRLRSPTAETVFSGYPGVQAIGAGVNPEAARPVSAELIEWADAVLVMENSHRILLADKYKNLLERKTLASLDIPDQFMRMQPELIKLLQERVPLYVRLPKP